MKYVTEYISKTLKEARESKGLSQRALSAKVGVPQSHISKIESGTVDLRLSSLIDLARVLDLELTLVPRKSVPAVQSIVRSSAPGTLPDSNAANGGGKELGRLQNTLASISKTTQVTNEFAQLSRRLKDMQHLRLDNSALKSIHEANKTLKSLTNSTKTLDAIRDLNSKFERIRNVLAHTSINLPEIEPVRPAYSLDEEDDNA